MIHKWQEIRDKMSPERLARIDALTAKLSKRISLESNPIHIFLLRGPKWDIRLYITKTWFSFWRVKNMTYNLVVCRFGMRLDLYPYRLDL
jgi:hypothetical protein